MKTFLIQTIDDQIKHDFAFNLVESINFNNWYYGEDTYKIKYYNFPTSTITDMDYKDEYKNCIPIGSLDFVFEYCKVFHYKNRKDFVPINIPQELMNYEFTRRNCYYANNKDIKEGKWFVKSATEYKKFLDIINDPSILPKDNYLVSEEVEIDSEWRAFIYNRKLVGLNNYAGDFTLFPKVNVIEKMIETYIKCPYSYTLDIGVSERGTFIIEVHPMISVGLYGFADYRILPQMFRSGFNWFIQ